MLNETKQDLLDYQTSLIAASITKFLQQLKALSLTSTADNYAEADQHLAYATKQFAKLKRSVSVDGIWKVKTRKDYLQDKS